MAKRKIRAAIAALALESLSLRSHSMKVAVCLISTMGRL
ncbi:hypothetical protein PCL1606_07600 [Pseudomonas chlororaphis]|uniref:Uncharacterized protein n=1 Tax=Pseudomonas chlororaphis TaxID=587753 RepID=A0A0D5XTS1_9PSED|nr:hypothetical protein PCL1606_07600 [Pseudomonas chlororaphis]